MCDCLLANQQVFTTCMPSTTHLGVLRVCAYGDADSCSWLCMKPVTHCVQATIQPWKAAAYLAGVGVIGTELGLLRIKNGSSVRPEPAMDYLCFDSCALEEG